MSSIIGNLPVTLANGTTADASQVMADLNYIVNQVNANAVAEGEDVTFGTVEAASLTSTGAISGTSITTTALNTMSDTTGGASIIAMTGNGSTTPTKYLGVLNGEFTIYSSSGASALLAVDDSGNLVATGNVTAYSDERLKKDWKGVEPDFIEKLSGIKSGTFTRTDNGERQAGVSAQDLQQVLPEAVAGAAILSVAYGQAALVACVELAKEVMRLRALLEPVK